MLQISLSFKILTETETSVLENGLDFTNQNLGKIFRSYPVECDVSGIFVMSFQRILVRHLLLDLNLYGNHIKVMFPDDISQSTQSNLSAKEWKALRGLAAHKTLIIKRADKGSSVIIFGYI